MSTEIAKRATNPASELRDGLQKLGGQFQAALPPHIPLERFVRVVQTAVNANDALLNADRRSLFESAMKAAQDGLLPDGRDGALVIYGSKVQWMPMIGGILKKIRNSGELKSIRAHVVHEKDRFEVVLGDDERIVHEPVVFGEQGAPVGAYAIAETSDGGVYREFMSREEIERVRSVSKAKNNGPWVQWWGEMARKTVLRRLAKRLPMSSDLDDLIRRDDELYDFESARNKRPAPSGLAARLTGRSAPGFDHGHVEREAAALDRPKGTTPAHDDDGVIEGETASDDTPDPADDPADEGGASSDDALVKALNAARTKGEMAGAQGRPKKAPNDLGPAEADAWIEGWEAGRAPTDEGAGQ